MLFYYINGSDRSSDVTESTLTISNQIQQRSDTAAFEVFRNSKPVANQDVKIYDGDLVSNIVGAVITLTGKFATQVNKFYAGQVVWLNIGTSYLEKATVLSYNEATLTLTLTATPVHPPSAGSQMGQLIFGGIVSRVKDKNLHSLSNLLYDVTCVDYTKIFDKKIVSDTWSDVDARYIINDFCNTTVNYNQTLDNLSYADNTSIQAAWTKSLDGSNPTVDLSSFIEGTSSAIFSWVYGSGTAKWEASLSSRNISDLLGVTSGTPAKGRLMLWGYASDLNKITSLKIRIGSSNVNYVEVTLQPTIVGDWGYMSASLAGITPTGTPNWTSWTYTAIIIAETASSSIKLNGLRVNDDSSFTLYNVTTTPIIQDYRSPQLKPTALVNQLAQAYSYVWYIDYERDIHFVTDESYPSPLSITDTSNNFYDLKTDIDASNIGNSIIINGGEMLSLSTYAQVFEGDGVFRVWLLKSKFANLVVKTDNGSSTKTTEATTNTTSVKITAHGFLVGDHIVNRTRSNTIRQILTVPDADHFTVEAIAGQTSGDSISYFAATKTIGVEGLVDETTVDYVYNSNEKSVRATSQTNTLTAGTFIRFSYNERLQIQTKYTNTASANALKSIGLGDGIFDLAPYNDKNITDLNTAILIAQAKTAQFSNPVINGSFTTDQRGLRAGQLITINQSTGRAINTTYVVQKIQTKQKGGEYQDYLEYSVTFGTTLFGWIEFMQKLLKNTNNVDILIDEVVETFVSSDEVTAAIDTNTVAKGGIKKTTIAEIPTTHDDNTAIKFTPPWHWEASVGQPVTTRWNLFSWS